MKNYPLEIYPPLARKAKIFLEAANRAQEIKNRYEGFWEVSYYLVSHSVELSIKATVAREDIRAPFKHDLAELASQYQEVCNISAEEMETIQQLEALNNGPGGLRYDNEPKGRFLPSTFSNGVMIVERLLEAFE